MTNYICRTAATAISSISHNGGQSFGIDNKLRREKFVQPDGGVEEVPVISGNAIRGIIRDVGMLHMCRTLGTSLPLPAFHFLFSGGSLTSDPTRSIGINEALRLRRLIPLASVFGGAVGNTILPGKLDIGKLIPVCAETKHLLPEHFASMQCASISVHEYLQDEMYTRKEDSGDQHKNASLAQPSVAADETAQMMYYVETFAAGTTFYWQIVLRDPSDMEFSAFATALREWLKRPVVGGKGNIGMGHLSASLDRWLGAGFGSDQVLELALPSGALYEEHIREHADEIRSLLSQM